MASTLVSVVPYSQPNARRTLHLQLEWGMDELLNAAGRRLDMISSPTRCFTSDGLEVTDVMMLVDGATIFVSCVRRHVQSQCNTIVRDIFLLGASLFPIASLPMFIYCAMHTTVLSISSAATQ